MWDRPAMLNAAANALFAVAFVLIAFMAVHFTVRLPLFPLRELVVTGELSRVTREQLRVVASQQLRGNFFTLDLAEARTALRALPWVREVSLRREWPDRLLVTLEEHQPLACWGDRALVNTYGEVFAAAYDGTLPVFIGPSGSARDIAMRYETFRRSLSAIGLAPAQVRISERRAWQIRLDSGLTLELGREKLEARVDRFVALHGRTLGQLQRRIDYVDLRYHNGFAVRIPGLRPDFEAPRRSQSPKPA